MASSSPPTNSSTLSNSSTSSSSCPENLSSLQKEEEENQNKNETISPSFKPHKSFFSAFPYLPETPLLTSQDQPPRPRRPSFSKREAVVDVVQEEKKEGEKEKEESSFRQKVESKLFRKSFNVILPAEEIDHLLTTKQSLLPRTILSACFSLSLSPPPPNLSEAISSLFSLSPSLPDLFLSAFEDELEEKRNLSVVMREASVAVCVLKEMWGVFGASIFRVAEPVLKFSLSLSQSKMDLLNSPSPSPSPSSLSPSSLSSSFSFSSSSSSPSPPPPPFNSIQVAEKLQEALNKMMKIQILPKEMCVMCWRCLCTINLKGEKVIGEDIGLNRWIVGSLLYLRFIIPIITNGGHSFGTFIEGEKGKAARYLGKFVMKLVTNSPFPEEGSLINKILTQNNSTFHQYCDDIIESGKQESYKNAESITTPRKGIFPSPRKHLPSSSSSLEKKISASELMSLSDFLLDNESPILAAFDGGDDLGDGLAFASSLQKFRDILRVALLECDA